MGRNTNGLEMTAEERTKLSKEWYISDKMNDIESRLKYEMDGGIITLDEYLDEMDRLRESAEKEDDYEEESDWDDFEDYMEAF